MDQAYQVPLEQWRVYRDTVEKTSAGVSYANAKGRKVNPLGYMVAEISWRLGTKPIYNETAYGSTENPALASAFEFDVHDELMSVIATDESTETNHQPATAIAAGFHLFDRYPDHAMPNLMLGNHDIPRLGDLIQRAGAGDPSDDAYWDRHKLAFTFLAAFSGPITIYYGQELGLEVPNFAAKVTHNCAIDGLCDDHVARSSGKVEGLNDRERQLKTYVAKLLSIREQNPALAVGSRTHLYADEQIYVDLKKAGKNRVLLVMNTKPRAAEIAINANVLGKPAGLTDLVSGAKSLKPQRGRFKIELPPLSAGLFRF